jgi:hypothetical protein
MCQFARVFIVAGHIHAGLRALHVLLQLRGGSPGSVFFDGRQIRRCGFASVKARGAEEDDGVLNLLAAETGQRLLILRQDSQDAPVWAVEKAVILVGDRRGLKMVSHKLGTLIENSNWKLAFRLQGPNRKLSG